MAHDINTPMASINHAIKLLKRDPLTEFQLDILNDMQTCSNHILDIVNSLRDQIRNIGSENKQEFKISKVLEDINIIVDSKLKNSSCKLEVDISEDVSIYGEFRKLSQVLINFIVNGVQAYEMNNLKGNVYLKVNADEKNIYIIVEDTAGGLPERVRNDIFNKILTTKGTSGTGIGMYLSYSIIKGNFGGDITYQIIEEKGTRFNIKIPRKGVV